MGGCCSSQEDDVVIEFNNGMNNCMCKSGHRGNRVKVSVDENKNIITVQGQGIFLGSCSLDGDTAYWEVVVGSNPENVKVGIQKYIQAKGDTTGNQSELLSSDLVANSDNNLPSWYLDKIDLKEGDVVGVYWDQTDMPMLSFSVNGAKLSDEYSTNRIRPTQDIYPAVSVKKDSSCCVIFDGQTFAYPPSSSKFGAIICSTNII